MRTTVGIVGGGPAGLLLARLLHRAGIACVVLENRSRAYAERRQRAGMLEQGTVDALRECGAGDRLDVEGLPHRGIELRFDRERHHIDFPTLTGGRGVMIYPQTEIVKDLIALQLAGGPPLLFEAEALAVESPLSDSPVVRYVHEGREQTLDCDYVVGCDGDHGVSRAAFPMRHVPHLRPRLPVLLARDPRRCAALRRGVGLRARCDRLRPAQHALDHGLAALPTGPERHRPRRLVRRAHLGRTRRALRGRRGLAAEPRHHHGQVRDVVAQSRPRADAPQ